MCVPALGMIGGLVSAVGSIYSGLAQSAAYKAEAQAKKMEAQGALEEGSYASNMQAQRNDRLTGQQVTALASSGVEASYGTAGDVIADSRQQGSMDVQAIRRNAQYRSDVLRYGAKIDKMNAGQAAIGGFIGALSPVIGGFTSLKTSFAT